MQVKQGVQCPSAGQFTQTPFFSYTVRPPPMGVGYL
jgi:hypothetical protein